MKKALSALIVLARCNARAAASRLLPGGSSPQSRRKAGTIPENGNPARPGHRVVVCQRLDMIWRPFLKGKRPPGSTALFLAALIPCLACGARGPAVTTDLDQLAESAAAEYNRLEVAELNGQFREAAASPDPLNYVLGGGDLVRISVFEAPELNTEARIGARGNVTLPLLNAVVIAGLSVSEAERHVERLYREKYLQDPHVSIFVTEQFGSKITLMGALRKPGTYDHYASLSLMDVLAMAGGLSDAGGRTVQVRRKGATDGETETLVIDLDQMIKDGREDLNVAIRGGDMVYVPEAGAVYVDGAVRRAGAYPVRPEMSVREAIVAAGGAQAFADTTDVRLVRYLGQGRREVARLSLDGPDSLDADRVRLRDRDVIFVPSSPGGTFIQGLRLTLGTGLVGVGFTPPAQ